MTATRDDLFSTVIFESLLEPCIVGGVGGHCHCEAVYGVPATALPRTRRIYEYLSWHKVGNTRY